MHRKQSSFIVRRNKSAFSGKGLTLFSERTAEGQQVTHDILNPTFYGVQLDKNDPFLSHNLDRLEKRFKHRFDASVEKNRKREAAGKKPHQTVIKSMQDNERRFMMVRVLRHLLLAEILNLEMVTNSIQE